MENEKLDTCNFKIHSFVVNVQNNEVIEIDGQKNNISFGKFIGEVLNDISIVDHKNVLSGFDFSKYEEKLKKGENIFVIPFVDKMNNKFAFRCKLSMETIGLVLQVDLENYKSLLVQQENLVAQIHKDSLTKIFNRDYMLNSINEYLGYNTKQNSALCLLDLNNMKELNDRYGHGAGDKLLVDFANSISSKLSNYLVGRYGGEEFIIFIKSYQDEVDLVNKLNEIVKTCNKVKLSYKEVEITFSIGVSHAPKYGTDFASLVSMAEAALFSAKGLGKNTFYIKGTPLKPKDRIGLVNIDKKHSFDLTFFYSRDVKYIFDKNKRITLSIIICSLILAALMIVLSFKKLLYVGIIGAAIIFAAAFLMIKINKKKYSYRIEALRAQSTDFLTNGVNERRFLNDAVSYTETFKVHYALVYVNIKNFKIINNLLGINRGTKAIQDLYKLLSDRMYSYEMVSRFNADKFVMLVEYVNKTEFENRFSVVAIKFNEQMEKEISHLVYIEFGVCPFDGVNQNTVTYVDKAMLVLEDKHQPKTNPYYHIAIFNDQFETIFNRNRSLEARLDTALIDGELQLYLQPKYDFKNKIVNGAEALIRWVDDFGVVATPGEFISLFERNGEINKIDFFVFEQVLMFLSSVIAQGKKPPVISINISKNHFEDPLFMNPFIDIFKKYHVPAECIEFEINERVISLYAGRIQDIISAIHNYGFKCSIDAFGSGFLSLNILKTMKIDVVKIDRQFFNAEDFIGNVKSKIIIRDIVSMIKRLGLQVVAEGVEMKEQSEFLREIKCDYMQGYYLDKPIETKEFFQKYIV